MLNEVFSPRAKPFRIIRGCICNDENTNFVFSPDMKIICVPGNATKTMATEVATAEHCATLCFFLVEPIAQSATIDEPYAKIGVEGVKTVTYVQWVSSTQQIFVATGDGSIKVFFDPLISSKGALLSYEKPQPRKRVDGIDSINEENTIWHTQNKKSKKHGLTPSKPPTQAHVSEGSSSHLNASVIMQKGKF